MKTHIAGLFLLISLLTVDTVFAQQSLEFNVNLGNTDPKGITPEFEVEAHPEAPFAGISAYVLRENVDMPLFFRVRLKEGWSDWKPLEIFTEGATEGRTAFEGHSITDPFTAIQFKSDKPLDVDIVFRIYFPAGTKKKSEPVSIQNDSGANCNCAQPLICLRNCWCPSGLCPKDTTPTFTQPDHIIVHHSAGSNSSNDYGAVVSYIWDLHVNTNGWDDIGYNWLIDPNGVVYEGRGDSVQGAHFSCMNGQTTGICVIGSFTNVKPADSAIASLIELITWEACDKNIAPAKSSFHNSSQLLLPNVAGHRHGNLSTAPNSCAVGTVCPGDSLFSLLPMIRDSAAANSCLGDVSIYENAEPNTALQLFPNPVTSEITLALHLYQAVGSPAIRIYDHTGKLVIRSWPRVNVNEEITLDVEDLAPGLYILQLISEGSPIQAQFIKK